MSSNVLVTDHSDLPDKVQALLAKREVAKQSKNYIESDRLRTEIEKLGYLVSDTGSATKILKVGDSEVKPVKSLLLLFGSGEIAPSSVDIYRQAFLSLKKRHLKIALVTTPAGFQPNVAHVYGEIRDFLLSSLPDFPLDISIVFANTISDANDSQLITQLEGVDIIFMGPGSPTYAVKHLQGTLLLTKIIDQVKNGSTLILASAATLACSRYCLPVYEIYKVGEDPHWVDGLNLYRDIWQEVSVIPHFNNHEGGKGLDTTHCFIGNNRFIKLKEQLPSDTELIGLDEHTVIIVDLSDKSELVRGKGLIHKL